ncbi:MAG: NACHT domain-containing protein [Stenomitos rutilans HA7619-LM2]|jgi:hypothetical protein|nr:NACHT domain-containing protein [Stenomitos rutilans HA7619-LM2]
MDAPMTGAEPFIFGTLKGFLASKAAEKAQETIASEITKSAWSSSATQVKPGSFTDQIKQKIFDASGQYISSYADRHGILKVLGMTEPVWIEDIYTRVQFLGNEGIRQYLSLENLEQAYRETQQRRFQSRECTKQDGLEVADRQPYLMVLGQPGAGKSTFLRRIGLEALKRDGSGYRHNCIPVFLELKRFNTGTVDIEQAIAREFETCNFPDPARSTKRLLEDGKLLVLLDGLDEVPTQQMDQAITQIQDFCDRYSQNRFIASCRTAAYRSRFRQFVDVIMADFDDEQIQQFMTNWFRSKDDQQLGVAQKCWNLLQQPGYASTRELAQTPLLLTFLCLVFDDAQTFPKQRAILYKDALDVLLKRWASEKRIQRDPIYQDLTLPLEEMMLAEIAYTGFVNDRLFFQKRDVVEQICTVLINNLNAPQHLDGDAVLDAIQIQQGILVERARNVLSFSHLTLQEYLTAQHIADNNLVAQLVADHLCDRRWREVFLLIAGLMRGGADALLLQMETAASHFVNTARLKHLLDWAEQATAGSEGDFKPVAKRSAAIFISPACANNILALTSALCPNLYYGLDSISLDLCIFGAALTPNPNLDFFRDIISDLDLAIRYNPDLLQDEAFIFNEVFALLRRCVRNLTQAIVQLEVFNLVYSDTLSSRLNVLEAKPFGIPQSCEARSDLIESIRRTWYLALSLDSDWVDWSEAEAEALNHYLYANELIVRCKEAAVRVSPQVWAGIEERMLTVRDEG